MLIKESVWIKDAINTLDLESGIKILNFGSQDSDYLKNQIYIKENVLNTCYEKGFEIINLDMKKSKTINIVGDISSNQIQKKLIKYNFNVVFLSNVLEHVDDIKLICDSIDKILSKGAYIIFTGPYNYPKHLDPIDNMFRPKPKDLLDFFSNYSIVKSDIIKDYTYRYYLTLSFKKFILITLRILTPFYKFNKWKNVILPKLKYFNIPYEVTCVILKKM